MSEHTQTLIDIRDSVGQLERRLDGRFDVIERRIDAVETKLDRRLDALEDKLERRFETLEDKHERRNEGLEDRMSRQFTWLVGIQVTTLVAIVGALLARS